jgi:hypothetical protein
MRLDAFLPQGGRRDQGKGGKQAHASPPGIAQQ